MSQKNDNYENFYCSLKINSSDFHSETHPTYTRMESLPICIQYICTAFTLGPKHHFVLMVQYAVFVLN